MGYEVRPDGTILVSSLDEAIALSKRLRGVGEPALAPEKLGGSAKPKPRAGTWKRLTDPEADAKARALLGTVAAGGKQGVTGMALAKQLGLVDARGLAGLFQVARKRVKERGKGKPEKYYFQKKRTRDRGAVWTANADHLKEIGLL